MKKKHIILFILSFILIQNISAQNHRFTKERRIYLWDVTLSMKGYQGKTPDIWDKVVKSLCDNIDYIINEDTEIIVLPYQERVLERWIYTASDKNKEELKNKIKHYNNETVTNTNNYTPFKDVIDTYLSNNDEVRNVIFLLTDGLHNVKNPSVEQFHNFISNWCEVALAKNAFAFYITLTEFAQDKKLSEIISHTCRITEIPYDGTINFIELDPSTKPIKYNIKDDRDKNSIVNFTLNTHLDIPSDIKIKLEAENNPYFTIDQMSVVTNNELHFKINLKKSYEELKKALPQDYNESFTIKLSIDKETSNKYPLVQLLGEHINLELINKPERTLKITVK